MGRVMLGIAPKYFINQPGLQNLLVHPRKAPLAVRFYGERWGERGTGQIMEVLPESFEFLQRSPA